MGLSAFLRQGTASFLSMILLAGPAYAGPASGGGQLPEQNPVLSAFSRPLELSHGTLEEVFDSGSPGPRVILIEDAHALPEAQSAIRSILEELQQHYRVSGIAVEGAEGRLDALFLRAFPVAETLEQVLEALNERAELTGPVAAAILGKQDNIFTGMEKWELYQRGYEHFLAALNASGEAEKFLEAWGRELDERRKNYSGPLREVTEALDRFYTSQDNLQELLLLLAGPAAPETGSLIALTLSELSEDSSPALSAEISRLETEIKNRIETLPAGSSREEALRKFNGASQAFATDRLAPAGFLAELYALNGSSRLGIDFSEDAVKLVERKNRLDSLKGGKWFEELDAYAAGIKEALITTEEERRTEREAEVYALFRKLVLLELTSGQRAKLEEIIAGENRETAFAAKLDALIELTASHRAFYENAGKRDRIFFERLEAMLAAEDGRESLILCVTGGFHTSALAKKLRESGRSYAVVRPKISEIPETSLYKEHMQGKVSWRSYFEARDGRVNLYDAFMRSVRDALLEETAESRGVLLKRWRDNLLRALAAEGRLAESRSYTRFIDEKVTEGEAEIEQLWRRNVDAFVGDLRELNRRERLDSLSAVQLLRHSHIPEAPKAAALMRAAFMPSGIFSVRSEMRNEEKIEGGVIRHHIPAAEVRNTFYMDPSDGVHFHGSIRSLGESEGSREATDVRALLSDGFIGFRTRITNGEAEININKYPIRSINGESGYSGMKGVEFDVSVDFPEAAGGSRTFDMPLLEAGSGLSIRDSIRMKRGEDEPVLDPKAAENIRGLAELGEFPYPAFVSEDLIFVERLNQRMRRLIFRNTVQHGAHEVKLELLFPEHVKVEVLSAEEMPLLRVSPGETTKSFSFTTRLLSSHDALTYYSEEEIYRPEILEFRDRLAVDVDSWLARQFQPLERREGEGMDSFAARLFDYEESIDAYKLKLREIKLAFERPPFSGGVYNEEAIRLNKGLIEAAEKIEQRLAGKGYLRGSFEGIRSLLAENRFDQLAIHKFDTYNDSLLTLRFLLSNEVMLAGSWQYLSYFGRDSILTARVLKQVLRPQVLRNLIQSVLDRVYIGSPGAAEDLSSERKLHVVREGEVAHEEDLRWPHGHPKRLDYRMMDGEFMLMTLVRDFMSMEEGFTDEEKAAFWSTESVNRPDGRTGLTNLEIFSKSAQYVLDKALTRKFVGMKDVNADGSGDPTGNWRDAMNSLARAMYPGDVNFEWIYAALLSLRAIERSFTALGLPSPLPEGYEIDDELIGLWKNAMDEYLVVLDTKERQLERLTNWYRTKLRKGGAETDFAASLMVSVYSTGDPAHHRRAYTYWRNRVLTPGDGAPLNEKGVNETAIEDMLEGFREHFREDERAEELFIYPALGKDFDGNNIEAVNGDHPAFAPLDRPLDISEIALAISPVLRHAAYGGLLWEEVGMIFTANPMLAAETNDAPVLFRGDEVIPTVWEMLNEKGYHGMVMWMSMVNLMTEGLSRQAIRLFKEARALARKGDHTAAAVQSEAALNTFLAVGLIRGNVNKLGSLKGEETIQARVDPETGRPAALPFADGIESNPAQAWNAAEIPVHKTLEELVKGASETRDLLMPLVKTNSRIQYPGIRELWEASRNNDAEIRRMVRVWTERVLSEKRRTEKKGPAPAPAVRSELRQFPERETLAGQLKTAARSLAPRGAVPQELLPEEIENSARLIVSLKDRPQSFSRIREALHSAVTLVLEDIRESRNSVVRDADYPVMRRLIEEKKKRLLAVLGSLTDGRNESGVAMGLQLDASAGKLEGREAADDYVRIFSEYLSGRAERLVLVGEEAPSITRPLEQAGFQVGTEKKMRKVLLTGTQKVFPFLISGMENTGTADASILPIGIRINSEIDREIAALARLTQVVYGFAAAVTEQDGEAGEALRRQIAAALIGEYDLDGAQAILVSGENGYFYINASALQLQIAFEIDRAIETSA